MPIFYLGHQFLHHWKFFVLKLAIAKNLTVAQYSLIKKYIYTLTFTKLPLLTSTKTLLISVKENNCLFNSVFMIMPELMKPKLQITNIWQKNINIPFFFKLCELFHV